MVALVSVFLLAGTVSKFALYKGFLFFLPNSFCWRHIITYIDLGQPKSVAPRPGCSVPELTQEKVEC